MGIVSLRHTGSMAQTNAKTLSGLLMREAYMYAELTSSFASCPTLCMQGQQRVCQTTNRSVETAPGYCCILGFCENLAESLNLGCMHRLSQLHPGFISYVSSAHVALVGRDDSLTVNCLTQGLAGEVAAVLEGVQGASLLWEGAAELAARHALAALGKLAVGSSPRLADSSGAVPESSPLQRSQSRVSHRALPSLP